MWNIYRVGSNVCIGRSCFYFYTAGKRVDPTNSNSAFVWNVTSSGTNTGLVFTMTYTNWAPGHPVAFANSCMYMYNYHYLYKRAYYRWGAYDCVHNRMCSICELDL